jgi:biopolymer transport protein TolR
VRLFVRHPAWTTCKKHTPLRTSIDVSAFASVMFALLFLMLIANTQPIHRGYSPADIPMTANSTLQPSALREDALEVAIARDGAVYFRNHRILLTDLSDALREATHNSADKTVYIRADARAKYADVKAVLAQIRQSGLQDITFLTRHPTAASTP